METVSLHFNDGFSWSHHSGISFKGYFFDENNQFFQGSQALDYFAGISEPSDLSKLLTKLDGCFSVIIELEKELILGVDTLSFFSLFYRKDPEGWKVSDSWYALQGPLEHFEPNMDAFPEFLSAGFVLGPQTLGKGLLKTEAASVVSLVKDGTHTSTPYWDFLSRQFMDAGYSLLKQQLFQKLEIAAGKLVQSLEGRTAVVPLSGGYDSRLIACMLKKAGYEKVICITYGRPGPETNVSKRVAGALGYPWFMVDYSPIADQEYLNDPLFQAYFRYAGNGFAMPYLQEFFAVRDLKEKGNIPGDAIFIPGHPGDWLAGSYIEKTAVNKTILPKRVPFHILASYFLFIPFGKSIAKKIAARISSLMGNSIPGNQLTGAGFNITLENWHSREKLPKFIFHSSQVFPFFGYAVRFPLWDNEFREYFRNIPFEFRKGKKLYNETIVQYYFDPYGVNFADETKRGRIDPPLLRGMKKKLKDYIPMSYILGNMRAHDHICYEGLTNQMNQEIKSKGQRPLRRFYSYNARICQWYLEKITDKGDKKM